MNRKILAIIFLILGIFFIVLGCSILFVGYTVGDTFENIKMTEVYCESHNLSVGRIGRNYFTCASLENHSSGIGSILNETGRIYFDDIK